VDYSLCGNKKVKIAMILDTIQGFPPDIRVEKEINALISAGFSVSLLSRKTKSNYKNYERIFNNFEVYRHKIERNLSYKIYYRISFIKKEWLNPIYQFIKNTKPDFIHAHDFTIVPTALKIAKKFHIPVVADLHEDMPAARIAYRKGYKIFRKFLASFLENYFIMRIYEKKILQQCIRIIVVSPEFKDRIINIYKIHPDKIIVVSNTEDPHKFDDIPVDFNVLKKYSNQWTMLYIGGIGPHRGLDVTLSSLSICCKFIPNLKLVIIGVKNHDQRKYLLTLIRKYNVTDYVEIIDWIDFDLLKSYILASKICLVPFNKSEHTEIAIPHKLFQYMLLKKPVIVSDCAALKRIVQQNSCGFVFRAGNPEDLARCIIKSFNLGDKLQIYAENAYKAAKEKYSWDKDARKLIKMYINLSHECKKN